MDLPCDTDALAVDLHTFLVPMKAAAMNICAEVIEWPHVFISLGYEQKKWVSSLFPEKTPKKQQ